MILNHSMSMKYSNFARYSKSIFTLLLNYMFTVIEFVDLRLYPCPMTISIFKP